jgi:long-chain acyl-CoA synthetase
VGQDSKYLAALVVPKFEALEEYAKRHRIGIPEERDELIKLPEIVELIKGEIGGRIATGKGFKVFERIFKFKILATVFEPGRELTHSLKLRRNVITDMYKREIGELYK